MKHILEFQIDVDNLDIPGGYANDSGAIKDLCISSGREAGLTLRNNVIQLNTEAYNSLAAGESEHIVASYNLVESNGAEIPKTACFTVTGTDQDPVITRIL